MTTYKIAIISTDLLNESKKLKSLIQEQEKAFECQSVKFKIVEIVSEEPIKLSELGEGKYTRELQECDICFILISWALRRNIIEELDTTNLEMRTGRIPRQIHVLFKESTEDINENVKPCKSAFPYRYGISYDTYNNDNSLKMKCKRLLSWIELYQFLIYSSCRVKVYNPKTNLLQTVFLYPQRFCIHPLDEVIMLCYKCMKVIEYMGKGDLVACLRDIVLFSDNHSENLSEIETSEALRRFEDFLQGIGLLLYGRKDSNDLQLEKSILSTRLSSLLRAEVASPIPTLLPLVDNRRAFFAIDDELLGSLLNTIRLFRNYNIHKKKLTPENIIFYNIGGCLSFDIRQNITLGSLLIIEHHFDYLLCVTKTYFIDK